MKTAFKVVRDSDFYKRSVEHKRTKKKVLQLLVEFQKEIGLQSENLAYVYDLSTIGVQEIDRQCFADSLRKEPDRGGYTFFKKNSKEAKRWREMTKDLRFDQNLIFDLISHNSQRCSWSTFFDDKEELYLLVKTDFPLKSFKEDVLEPIKLSEYYQIIEKIENKH